MNGASKDRVTRIAIAEAGENQRLDNFLRSALKGVPKSHIYRIVRSGEVRVNSRRVGPDHRLKAGDELRIPPVAVAARSKSFRQTSRRFQVLFEDADLLAIDKPADMAVHGGSGVSEGVIEQLRRQRPEARFLELVHRLDKSTSGVLLLAKKRTALTSLHAQLREGLIEKSYWVLVRGNWSSGQKGIHFPLRKYLSVNGERRVSVDPAGRPASTEFALCRSWPGFSLLEARLLTGRTHQIRVHLAHAKFPIAGDDKYGDFAWNKALAKAGLKRMFLHAARAKFAHPRSGQALTIEASLPLELERFVARVEAGLNS